MEQPHGRLVSSWTSLDGRRIHSRRSIEPVPAGQPPIVCVHGLSVSSRYMVPTATRLAPYHRVYAPDLPGFGKSDHPPRALTVAELADALARWMDIYDLPRAVLLGNSMGCQIIADLAARSPSRISHAVLVGPTFDAQARSLWPQALRLLRDIRHESLVSVATQARDYWACGVLRTIATFRAGLADRIECNLRQMRAPALIVRGEHDQIAPQEWVETLARIIPRSQLVVLPDAPHAANYDAPTALTRVVRAFLRAHPAPPFAPAD